MNRDRHLVGPLDGLEPAGPPPGLRARTLDAAAEALEEAEADPWARLWHARGWRYGWLAAASLLVLGHLSLALEPSLGAPAEPPVAAAITLPPEELAEVMTLPPVHLDSRAFSGGRSHPPFGSPQPEEDPEPRTQEANS